jgi:hypothetical protein
MHCSSLSTRAQILSNATELLSSNVELNCQYIYTKYLYLLLKCSSIDYDVFFQTSHCAFHVVLVTEFIYSFINYQRV